MESLADTKLDNQKEGFFTYLFNFDKNNKAMLSNLFQFAFIAAPLIIIVLKTINHYTPDENEDKGTLEIFLEVILSLSSILLSIWFINKIVRYIPTYSGEDYNSFNETTFIIPFLILLFTMQTKIGTKINILIERLIDIYEGKTNLKNDENEKNHKNGQQAPQHQMSQADLLPSQQIHSQGLTNRQFTNQPHQQHQSQANKPDFNNMFAGPNTPLMNANEPIAANEAGGLFGSIF